MLFLDTCVVVDILRGEKAHYLQRLRDAETAGRGIVVSSLVLHELAYGAMISARADLQLSLLDAFADRVQVEPWSAEDAVAAARIRADLKVGGTPLSVIDSLIAGQALNRSWPVVTANLKDFVRVRGLAVVDWSDPAGPREIDEVARDARTFANLSPLSKETK